MFTIIIYISSSLLFLSILTYLIPLIYQNYLSARRRDVRYYVSSVVYQSYKAHTSTPKQTFLECALVPGSSCGIGEPGGDGSQISLGQCACTREDERRVIIITLIPSILLMLNI